MVNAITKQQDAPARDNALLWFQQELLPAYGGNLTAACKEVDISPKTIKGLLAGTYGGNAARQLAKLREARGTISARLNMAGGERDLLHIRTALMNRVWAVCDASKTLHLLNYVAGKSQIGKTTALESYAKEYPETTYLLRMPTRPTVTSMLRELLEVCGLPAARTADRAMRQLRAHLTARHLLIVDEAHAALTRKDGLDCLDCLRELFDRCKCGMVLAVTDVGAQSIVRGQHAERLIQLEKRGEWTILPTAPSPGDVVTIWRAYGLEDPDDETQRQVAAMCRASGFGQYCHRLQIARADAAQQGRQISWRDFKAAAERTGRRPE